ncbi:SdpI family protein [Arcanobacterium haemolyticum]|uniref:SdpI/YhfL protein family n=2 Tax=Arcanobacterium haemolyticum TaxID=28264 RepID=D7BKP5_ARCHD|nr:hypothetical protein Arch_1529 [Arcanobacterium haemolyticum DSM 20595]QCX47273.1 SdpI family protein [Arcanobacterium haemolyticum]SQH28006.1 Predicted integral membrane protein [Arcanobacterium haemolyticum]
MVETIALVFCAIVIIACGVGLVVIGTRMKSGKFPPNGIVGTRTEFSMKSEENWYFVQRLTGAPIRWLGYSMFLWIPAFVAYKFTNNDDFLYVTVALQMFLIILFWIIYFSGTRRHQNEITHKD